MIQVRCYRGRVGAPNRLHKGAFVKEFETVEALAQWLVNTRSANVWVCEYITKLSKSQKRELQQKFFSIWNKDCRRRKEGLR